MTFMYAIAGVITVGALIYLLIVLFKGGKIL